MRRLFSFRKVVFGLVTMMGSLWHTSTIMPTHGFPTHLPYESVVRNLPDLEFAAIPALKEHLNLESYGIAHAATLPNPSKSTFATHPRDLQYIRALEEVSPISLSRHMELDSIGVSAVVEPESEPEMVVARIADTKVPGRQVLPLNIDVFSKDKDAKRVGSTTDWNGKLPAYLNKGRFVDIRRRIQLDDAARIVRERMVQIPVGDDVGLVLESRINDDLETGKSYGVGVGFNIKF